LASDEVRGFSRLELRLLENVALHLGAALQRTLVDVQGSSVVARERMLRQILPRHIAAQLQEKLHEGSQLLDQSGGGQAEQVVCEAAGDACILFSELEGFDGGHFH
jgi:hypothetical protein